MLNRKRSFHCLPVLQTTQLQTNPSITVMFEFTGKSRKLESKCYVTHGTMGHLDPKQPPVQRKPFASVLAVPFVHKVELVLPKELYDIIEKDLTNKIKFPMFSRVTLPLRALLESEFFNEYIKKGNILMLSEGINGLDNVFSLREGILTMTLEKENYERAGLVGKPDGAKGKRGLRPRWTIELNLRLPSMLHGKKGFDRLLYACKNVLTSPVTWLFVDLNEQTFPNPLSKHFPTLVSCIPKVSQIFNIRMPCLQPDHSSKAKDEDSFSDFATDMYEWLSMISLESPRIDSGDQIDPFLSRYSPPDPEDQSQQTKQLIKVTWEGFISAAWAHKTLINAILASSSNDWFCMSVIGFNESISNSNDVTMLKIPGSSNEYVRWEVEQS